MNQEFNSLDAQREACEAFIQSQCEMKLIEDSYGPDHLNLVLARGYLVSLLNNDKVIRYLDQNHHEILNEFQKISEIDALAADDTR